MSTAPDLSTMVHKPERKRRTRQEMTDIKDAIVAAVSENEDMTLRQLYYVLVSRGVFDKTEQSYAVLKRLGVELRRDGVIPWHKITDETRWLIRPSTHGSLESFFKDASKTYRRSLWVDADVQVEIWCESTSIAGVISDTTSQWDVPLYPCRGYGSHSFLWCAAQVIAARSVPTVIYLLGDYDPSGQDIIRFTVDRLTEYSGRDDIVFRKAAVLPEQIKLWNLPSHPAKKTDSRHARYQIDDAVELEAIPPKTLNALIQKLIFQHLDSRTVARMQIVEKAERETLAILAKGGLS